MELNRRLPWSELGGLGLALPDDQLVSLEIDQIAERDVLLINSCDSIRILSGKTPGLIFGDDFGNGARAISGWWLIGAEAFAV